MLKRDFFKGKRVTVFGIGLNRGALGAIHFLMRAGVKEVIATDIRSREELASTLQELEQYKNITYVLGQHRPEDFTRVDMVLKNPVIPWTNEYIKLAREQSVLVEMDASLFFQIVRCPVIGVTGTKGKTTTAELIACILEEAGKPVVRAGINQIGFLDVLEQMTEESVVVAELSSWRLSSLAPHKISPTLSVVTNIYPDHLNYYKNMEVYVADKEVIWRYQKKESVTVLNADNPGTKAMGEKVPGRVLWFSENTTELTDGIVIKGDTVIERRGGVETELFPLSMAKLLGRHNRSNILAAAAAARAFGIEENAIAKAIIKFTGVPHRLELVGERDNIAFVNDSASTAPEATIGGIAAFVPRPVILIAGGADKAFQYEEFSKTLVEKTKAIIFLKGSATEKMLPLVEKFEKERGGERIFPVVSSMEDAIHIAKEEALAGDVVLLSPGVASFGLFKNEFDRGDQFRSVVQKSLGLA